jgi:hypothetical protein
LLYLDFLEENRYSNQIAIENVLAKFMVQPVGDGYIDLIISTTKAVTFIQSVTDIPIAIEGMSWWCNMTEENTNKYKCPHGMGGPTNKFGEGFFSECDHYPMYLTIFKGNSVELVIRILGELLPALTTRSALTLRTN